MNTNMNDFFSWLEKAHPEIQLTPLQALLSNSLYSIGRGGGKTLLVNLWYEYEQYLGKKCSPLHKSQLKYYIVAHTEVQANYFARNNELRKTEFRYVDEKYRLQGIKDKIIIFLGGWQHHRDAPWMWEYCQTIKGHQGIKVLEMEDIDLIKEKLSAEDYP